MPAARALPEISFLDVVRFAAGYWRRQPVRMACFLALMTVAGVAETNLPNMLADFLAAVRQQSGGDAIIFRLEKFMGNYFLYLGLYSAGSFIYNVFETNVFKAVRDDAFTHVHEMSEPFFINTFAGSIISKITRARNRIETFEDMILLRILTVVVVLVSSTIFLALRFPMLAVLVVVYVAVLIVVSIALVLRFVGPSQSAYANAEDYYSAQLADSISGIATTKSFAREGREIGRFVAVTESLRAENLRAYTRSGAVGLVQRLMLSGMLALLLGGGTWYFLHGKASIEDMAYLVLAYTITQSYVRDIGDNIKNILTSSYDLHAIIALMREKPAVQDKVGAVAVVMPRGAIAFKDVTFTYPGKAEPIFDRLSLEIKGGERIALVGHSGSGKTTFVRLVQRLYDLERGAIAIDGQNISDITQHSLRSAIALVPQDPILFHRTLQQNIAYGRDGVSLEDVRRAAEQAHIDDFIMSLPQKYDTLVGERGVKLSGGERQRVAIARAILADRPILILDEATSSLDSASEKAIQDALQALTHGRTSIMIAHRLSTILDADRILVFDKGRIVEQGTHAALLERNGIYAELFRLQSGGFIGD